MKDTFVILLAGHLLSDFVLQSDTLVQTKHRLTMQLVHALFVMIVTAGLLGTTCIWPILLVFVAHLGIDIAKSYFGRDGVYTLLIDQVTHVLALIAISLTFPQTASASVWLRFFPVYLEGLILLSGLILCVPAGSVLIARATAPLFKQLDDPSSEGLSNGGKWIGQLERALIFLLVISGQASAIGFLFAAKSILRFGEIKDSRQRKQAEYIIIGTLMSFGWALLVANLTQKALELW